jgi:RND family efflux transporter MFP subunit
MNNLISSLTVISLWCVASLAAAGQVPSVLVRTTPVVQKTLADTLTAYGVLEPDPDQVLSLSLAHAGLINRVWVRLGQRVKSGDALLEVITAPDAHMQYLQAKSGVDYAEREYQRQQDLLPEQLTTKAQVDTAAKNLHDARATLEALRKRGMDTARETLRAPMDGIITRLDVAQGQRVQSDTTVMLIAAEQRLIARLGVEPEDLGAVQAGTRVTITSVFVPGLKVDSEVREVHAMIDPDTHLVEVLAPIPAERSERLVLGSRIQARFHLAPHPALVVARSAVLGNTPDAFVYVVAAGKARRVKVQTGTQQGNEVEVRGALHAGDRVVVSGNYELADGMAVRTAR